jgi:alkanesulfonate monooxygenase SsuD/methylene tetrahydromethanopterin reductase-like flavin-dependent oxidoreductase (luciferase family)
MVFAVSNEVVRVGCAVPVTPGTQWSSGGHREAIARIAGAGLDHVVFGDHVSFLGGAGTDGLLHAAAALGQEPELPVFVAVYLLALRHPVVVARQLADLDVLAPGLLTLGIGLGGEDRHEFEVCGIDPATRGRRTDECLTVLRGLLAGESVTFAGRHIGVDSATVTPAPSRPTKIIIGGRSDAALTRAARFGDGWIGIWLSANRFADAVAAIQGRASAEGRTVDRWSHALNVWCGLAGTKEKAESAIANGMQTFYNLPYERFARWSPAGTPDEVAEFLAPYIESGCTTLNLIPCGDEIEETVEMAAKVGALLRT